jgi:hypothetical protein
MSRVLIVLSRDIVPNGLKFLYNSFMSSDQPAHFFNFVLAMPDLSIDHFYELFLHTALVFGGSWVESLLLVKKGWPRRFGLLKQTLPDLMITLLYENIPEHSFGRNVRIGF